ncbi:MAG TPA: PAS domain-containing sensor histidine kinase, partial [Gemmatimonadaceae bacterium]|nr:PAS domain-containing sensor histidine kinase [Gemmatimonadaceae bacterium]
MDDLLDTAPCGFLSFADDGTIVGVNGTLLAMLGYERDELPGRHVELLLTSPSRIFYQTHFFPILRLEGKAEEIFVSLRAKSGREVAALVNAARRERGGSFVSDCAFIPLRRRREWEDEILRAKKAAEDANRAKSKFLSMMSHELRTPLGAISGYADILSMGIRGPVSDAQLDDLRRIKSASQYLLGLINNLLNIGRLEAGQLDLELRAVSADAVLAAAESLVGPRLREAGIDFVREGPDADVAVLADAERLQQILLNLLTNAIKFTPRGGRITVSREHANGRARIRVRDTGRGIPGDQMGRIFEPFVQVDRDRNESSQQGVGLGLAI